MSKFCEGSFLFFKQPSLTEAKKNTRNLQLTTAGEGT